MNMKSYLEPTYFVECDSPAVIERARSIVGTTEGDVERAIMLYYAVRDEIRYSPYRMSMERGDYRAAFVLEQGEGFCVQKAILLAALSRASGVPCRLRFADVRNHLVTRRLRELMKTDLFAFHGYNEFLLEGKWIKATPAFNLSLCEKFGVLPLEFDGRSDSILHPFDRSGNRHMEYLYDYGPYHDLPFDLMIAEFKKHYPHIVPMLSRMRPGTGDFDHEAEEI